jgi:hypothetical protein
MINKFIAAIAISSAVVVAAPAVATAAEPNVAVSKASDYSTSKKNQFWNVARSLDPMVKYAGKKSTINLGVATCDLLRAGGDMEDLAMLVVDANVGAAAESALIAVIASAPAVLCPDQQYKFD